MFGWSKETSRREKRTFWICFGDWALGALDVQMFSLVIPTIIVAWHTGKAEVGLVPGVTLMTLAPGNWIAGALTDRFGRVRTLQVMVLWFSLATFASALTQNFEWLLMLKAIQGFGFGGEWAAGTVLMVENIRAGHHGKVVGTVQSVWVVGWDAAVLLYALTCSFIKPNLAWRAMLATGLLPVLLTIYIRRGVKKPVPAAKPDADANAMPISRPPLLDTFYLRMLHMMLIGGLLEVGAHGGYYALMMQLPTYLKTEYYLPMLGTGGYLAVIIFTFWYSCVTSAWLLDVFGRYGNILLFLCCCVITVLAYLLIPPSDSAILVLGSLLGFFTADIPADMGTLFNELYPQGVRGTGVGFCYNSDRVVSAAFPMLVGKTSTPVSLGAAIGIDVTVAYSIVAVTMLMLSETKGRDPAAVMV